MSEPEDLKIFPNNQIKPYDGMSVTADVWKLAHAEHRQGRRAHDLFFHGSGIITGLEVIANDPPNQFVFISPGAAVDPEGNIIVLTEPVAYDFGNTAEGPLFLLLGHGEREVGGVEKEIITIQDEFVIAARPSLPKRPVVELARVTIPKPGTPLKNPALAGHPQGGDLDLRFRKDIGPQVKQRVRVALCSLGTKVPSVTGGWDHLNRECARSMPVELIIDTQVSFTDDLAGYGLIYLSGKGAFKTDGDQAQSLRAALDKGSMLIVEALDEPAEKSFQPLLEKMELKLSAVEAPHALLTEPYLFNSPPQGALGKVVRSDNQVIFSTAGYSLSWNGESGAGPAARAEIRSAHEWGLNLLHYCVQRTRS